MNIGDKVRYIAKAERKRLGFLEAINLDGKIGKITRVGKGEAEGYVQVWFPTVTPLWSETMVEADSLVVLRMEPPL